MGAVVHGGARVDDGGFEGEGGGVEDVGFEGAEVREGLVDLDDGARFGQGVGGGAGGGAGERRGLVGAQDDVVDVEASTREGPP